MQLRGDVIGDAPRRVQVGRSSACNLQNIWRWICSDSMRFGRRNCDTNRVRPLSQSRSVRLSRRSARASSSSVRAHDVISELGRIATAEIRKAHRCIVGEKKGADNGISTLKVSKEEKGEKCAGTVIWVRSRQSVRGCRAFLLNSRRIRNRFTPNTSSDRMRSLAISANELPSPLVAKNITCHYSNCWTPSGIFSTN
jgi:hypothetical protein